MRVWELHTLPPSSSHMHDHYPIPYTGTFVTYDLPNHFLFGSILATSPGLALP